MSLYITCILRLTYLLAISILSIVFPVFSQNNMLDPTFGNGGKVVTPINDSSTANAIAIQNDGKIIVAGSTTLAGREYSTLVRYNIDGSLDNTFGSAGKLISLLPGVKRIYAIALQQDGKILTGGISNDSSLIDGNFTLTRYKMNGSTDSLFGNTGTDKVPMRGLGTIKKIIIRSDGKILAGGTLGLATFENIPALVLLNTDGSVDSSFGVNGRFQDYVNNDTTRPIMISDMALSNDGKIVATGETGDFRTAFAVFRYLPNGILDSAFGVEGLVNIGFYNTFNYNANAESVAVVVQPDNKIVVAGYSYQSQIGTRFSLAKLNTNGFLDSTFGTAGKAIAQTGLANRLLTDPNGNLVLTGFTSVTGNSNFAAAKYFANGKTDSTFGTDGVVTTDFSGFADQSYAAVIQSDGKIILAGQVESSSSKYSIALARYSITVLPLKLLGFTTSNDGKYNLLQWTTANEINVVRFEIERSANGKDYNTIGKTSSSTGSYSFTDAAPLPINYYRLKMVDSDGKFEYSSVRMISNTGSFYVNAYPVPATGRLNIQIISTETEKANISVFNVLGKKVITSNVSLTAGVNNTFIKIESFSKGAYFLKVITPKATETIKIIVTN